MDDARTQSPDKFAATVRKHEQRRSTDDGVSKLKHQRSRRFAKIRTDVEDGMTVLYGRFDPVTGARIETALSKKMSKLWHEEDPRNRATPGQRMADALEALITRPGASEDGKTQDVKLMLIADYDTVSQQLRNARLENGTPIPAAELRRLACDAQILPAIFRGPSQPLDLGKARRKASSTQRSALIARDRACIGCGAKAAWCQSHHIVHWQDGGPTNLDNMCLLCSRCHHKVHDKGLASRAHHHRRLPAAPTTPRPDPSNSPEIPAAPPPQSAQSGQTKKMTRPRCMVYSPWDHFTFRFSSPRCCENSLPGAKKPRKAIRTGRRTGG